MAAALLGWLEGSDRKLTSLESRAYAELKGWILNLELAPDEPLTHAELADRLGISNTPIRGALAELEREGLVVSAPYKGARVASLSIESLRDLYQLREAIERFAVRQAVDTFTQADLDKLDQLLHLEAEAIRENIHEDYDRANEGFHRLFVGKLKNAHFTRIFENILDHHHRVRRALVGFMPNLSEMRRSHGEIVAAIRDGDREKAEEYVKRDVATFVEVLEQAASSGWFDNLGQTAKLGQAESA